MSKENLNNPKYWAINVLSVQEKDRLYDRYLQTLQQRYNISTEQWKAMQEACNRYIQEVANIIK